VKVIALLKGNTANDSARRESNRVDPSIARPPLYPLGHHVFHIFFHIFMALIHLLIEEFCFLFLARNDLLVQILLITLELYFCNEFSVQFIVIVKRKLIRLHGKNSDYYKMKPKCYKQ